MKTSLPTIGLALATLLSTGCAHGHASQRPSMIRKKVTQDAAAGDRAIRLAGTIPANPVRRFPI